MFPFPVVNEAGDLAHLSVFIDGDSLSQDAVDVVTDIRERYVPQAFERSCRRGVGGWHHGGGSRHVLHR